MQGLSLEYLFVRQSSKLTHTVAGSDIVGLAEITGEI